MAEFDDKIDSEIIRHMREVASNLKVLEVPPSQGLRIMREYLIDYTDKSGAVATPKKGS